MLSIQDGLEGGDDNSSSATNPPIHALINYNESLKLYRTLRHDKYSEVVITVSE